MVDSVSLVDTGPIREQGNGESATDRLTAA